MRMSPMMSDLLVACSIALLHFWCLDAKGGEVVLFRISSGLCGLLVAASLFVLFAVRFLEPYICGDYGGIILL
jgi:hypothetical protein